MLHSKEMPKSLVGLYVRCLRYHASSPPPPAHLQKAPDLQIGVLLQIMRRFEKWMPGMGRFNLKPADKATLEQHGSVTVFRDATDGSGQRLRVIVERERPAAETDASE